MKSVFSYLEETWGHGSSRHAVIRWHVAHHWTWSSGRTLKYKNKKAHNLSISSWTEQHQDNQDGVKIIMFTGNNGKRDMAAEIICQQTSNPDYTFLNFWTQMEQLPITDEDMIL